MTSISRITRQLLCWGGIVFIALAFAGHTSAQTCVEPPAGLVGWWPGDGNADDIVDGNHGTMINGAKFASGKVGQAFSFNGISTYVKVNSSPSLDLTGDFTIDAWVRPNDGYGSPQNIYNHIDIVGRWGPAGIGKAAYLLAVNPIGKVYVMTHDGYNPTSVLTSNTKIPVNIWSHVTGVRENTKLNIYINGVLDVNYLDNSVAPQKSYLSLTIGQENEECDGCNNPGGNNFDGLIDEVEIYNRALSQNEVFAIFNAGSAGKCKFQTISIDIKPGSYPNCFNINGHGVIPVAILGSEDLDVTTVDTSTLIFGGLQVRVRGNKGPLCHIEDVSGDFTNPEGAPDGYFDLVCQFEDDSTTWVPGNAEAELKGALLPEFGKTPIKGSDSICVKPE